jgi:YYY domain-containing protein
MSPEDLHRMSTGGESMSRSLDIEKVVPNVNLGTSRGKLIPLEPALLVWWILITALGWLALPLASRVFKNFPDGGWAVSRAMGLLLFSWLAFVLVSKTNLPFYQSSLWGLLAGLVAVNAVVTFINRKAAASWLKPRFRTMLWTEAVFAGAFLFFTLIRFFNPNIHDIMSPGYFGGGEPLGMTYLNAVTRCSDFPVFDPWLAGASSSYYYFGYVMAAVMTKLSGALPAVTYNLSLAMFFSLAVLTAWGLGLALTGKKRFALVAGAAVAAFGSMWVAPYISQWIADHAKNLLQIPLEFFGGMFSRSFIWDPTRFPGLVPGAIYEFPFFSYLYSDLHPHNMVLPFSLVLLSLFLAPFLSAKKGLAAFGENKLNLGLWIFLTALFLDSQYAINTWSWPVFLGVGLVCLPLAGWAGREGDWKDRFITGSWSLLILVAIFALGYLVLMQPFREHFLQDGGERLHRLPLADRKRPFYQTIAFYFFGLMGLATLTGLRLKSWWNGLDQSLGRLWAIALWVSVIVLLLVMAATGVLRGQVLWFAAACAVVCTGCFSMQRALDGREAFVWALAFSTFGMVTGSEIWYVSDRMNTIFKFWLNGWVFFGLVFTYGFWRAELACQIIEEQINMSKSAQSRETGKKVLTDFPWRRFIAPAVGVLAFVSLFVFARLDQTSGNSGNFAFSAAWLGVLLLLSMAAAFVPKKWARPTWRGLFVALLIFGMLYPLGASWARISITSRFYDHYRGNTGLIDAIKRSPGLTSPTLDGLEFLRTAKPRRVDKMARDYDKHDAVMIDWLNKNADLTEVVLEAPGVDAYKGLTRISIYTGLPTLLGWKYQVSQQLGNRTDNQLTVRQRAADRIYRSRNEKVARKLLDQYKVRWIVVGGIEQRVYDEKGLAKFADFCEAVAKSGDSVLYRYTGAQ